MIFLKHLSFYKKLALIFFSFFISSYTHALSSIPYKNLKGKITGNFDMTSNYVSRGMSQTNNNPAVQGGFTSTVDPIGFYFNVWGSNVYFVEPDTDVRPGRTGSIELDTIVGITRHITDKLNYDINLARYNYPRASRLAYNELSVITNYNWLTGKIAYSPNVYNSHHPGTYYFLGTHYDIPDQYIKIHQVGVGATVGHYDLPEEIGYHSYNDYSLMIKKSISFYTFILQWTGTQHGHNYPADGNHLIGTILVDF